MQNVVKSSGRDTLIGYQTLLHEIDSWFAHSIDRYPEQIHCKSGCSECCCSLFDITMLDAANLQEGFDLLTQEVRDAVIARAGQRLLDLQEKWPDLKAPFILNYRPEEEWQELMPPDDEIPCVLLGDDGRCLVYEHRPMTCRLHGLPLVDISGEVMHDEWCTKNFNDTDPLLLPELSAPFDAFFRREAALDRRFNTELFGEAVFELDTFIPLALLPDFRTFDWQEWWRENRMNILTTTNQNTL